MVPRKISWRFLLLLLVIGLGLWARIYQFWEVPGDINQDEAFAGYEAYSLLLSGKDSHGYAFPVYLTAWGSGMNALNTYLMIPFVALFGLHTWVIRLPQLIVGCLSIPVTYLTMKRLSDGRMALFTTFFLSIAPWHIMLSRWGLESNLAPGFLLFGFYFFLKGVDNPRFFLLSALLYGISLYSYATIWLVVPLTISLQLFYCFHTRRLKCSRYLLASGVLLFLLAMPLLLFLLINLDYMEEIRLPFLSVPRLLYMRFGDISSYNIKGKLYRLFQIMLYQTDGLPWNSAEGFGMFYLCSLPFFIIGLLTTVVHLVKTLRTREYTPIVMLLPQLMAGILLGSLCDGNINRLNSLFMPVILLIGYGIISVFDLVHKYLFLMPTLFYLYMFISFESFYFNDYATDISFYFCKGLELATGKALEMEGTIYVDPHVSWPRILFFSSIDPDKFRNTVEYSNYPNAFLDASTFGSFRFGFPDEDPDASAVYILDNRYVMSDFELAGFQKESYGYYMVAWHDGRTLGEND